MRKTLISLSAVLLVSITQALPNVFNFEIPKIDGFGKEVKSSKNRFTDNVSQLLMQYHMSQIKGFKQSMIDQLMKTSGLRSQINGFKWKDCGSAAGKISTLNISPDPIQFPGTITVSVGFTLNTTLDRPLAMDVLWYKKSGSTYIKIPCIGMVGSCTYNSVCSILADVQCPDPLVQHGIPCQCPFKKNTYNLPATDFEVDAAFLPEGDYHINAIMSVIWEKKNDQGQFVEIPCVEDLFTCNYTDICELMDQIVQCPDPLVAAGISCQCPITKGQYLMNNANFEIDAAFLSQGDYRIKVMAMAKGKLEMCIDMSASVSSG
ncbi:GM2A [Mytilus coruscus]|uniref:GM2A n=1 Tax=Mytilus coruscus TaxID=42192 RepID=A0A6J8BWL4_MYTCO|nr:GM2A [Mytilus coruscus]